MAELIQPLKKLKLESFNNLTKTLSFNIYDICYAQSEKAHECRKAYGKGGKFLFGKFCNSDAMFAPVVTRFETYAIPVAEDTRAYMDAVLATKAFQTWKSAALKESWIVAHEEVD